MSTRELPELVREASEIESRDATETTIEAFLEALGESISRGEAEDIAVTLPEDHARILTSGGTAANPMDYDRFLDRIADARGIPRDRAEREARSVMAALSRIAGEAELERARDQLPPAYDRLFDAMELPPEKTMFEMIRDSSDIDSIDGAREAARPVLETLGERLTRGEAEDLARFLHDDPAEWLAARASDEAEDLSPEEFVDRVAERADLTRGVADEYTRAVLREFSRVVPEAEMERATEQLPEEYAGYIPAMLD